MTTKKSEAFFNKTSKPSHKDYALSARGRFSRMSYIAWVGFGQFLFMGAFLALSVFMGILNIDTLNVNSQQLDQPDLFFGGISLFIVLFFIYLNWVFTVRRLHDLNHNGWLYLLFFVPILNFFFGFYLLVARGSERFNHYGAPRATAKWETVFAWFMIVLGLLSLVSISSTISYFVGSGELDAPKALMQKTSSYF
ncbi:DUF805 domain-containing protein [Acinetobacter sp. MD2(2019)]|uniref:DUF805 domain-containing protein n=1 Tax=Acinetobacter sp. MD2(2019) TaxID=2605273 RepID=UPI002D1F5C7F|nr:DUF805 domain-containing protein [Acinetobacter sp. MD2(2019)]MEB3753104.1 DUF805 domain-containing protein [Acinetobacter sp. MD2(2019)]